MDMSQSGVNKVLSQIESFRFVINSSDHDEIEDDEQRLAACADDNRAAAEHSRAREAQRLSGIAAAGSVTRSPDTGSRTSRVPRRLSRPGQ